MRVRELMSRVADTIEATRMTVAHNAEIVSVRFMRPGQTAFHRDTVYIGPARLLFSLSPPSNSTFCITDAAATDTEVLAEGRYNILLVTDDDVLPALFNTLQDLLSHADPSCAAESLLDCVVRGDGLDRVVETAHALIGNPVVLLDTSYKLLTYKAGAFVDDPVWNNLVDHGYSSVQYIVRYKDEKIIERVLASDAPVLLDDGLATDIRRYVGKVTVGRRCVGYLVALEHDRAFADGDREVVEQVCDVISVVMAQDKRVAENKGTAFESILLDLLDGAVMNEEALRGRLASLGLQTAAYNHVVVVDIAKHGDPHSVDVWRNRFLRAVPSAHVVFFNDSLVAVVQSDHDTIEETDIDGRLRAFMTQYDVQAGAGLGFTDLSALSKHYRCAESVLRIGRQYGSVRTLYHLSEFAVVCFVHDCLDHMDIAGYCHPWIFKLEAYDRLNNTEYYKTCAHFLLCHRNVGATAAMLNIHRNTVAYRLEKIEELLAVDLQDDKAMESLGLSFLLHDARLLSPSPDHDTAYGGRAVRSFRETERSIH